jgi:nucleotide-binding universal stress UspA family protein
LVAVAGYTDPATGKREKERETIMERNIRYACNLAKRENAKLTIIHVISLPVRVISLPTTIEPQFGINLKVYEDAGRGILENGKTIAKKMGTEPDTILARCFGNPAHKIVQVAEEGKFDLITISSKEHSALHNVLIGSVCDTVTRYAPCPVLVIR